MGNAPDVYAVRPGPAEASRGSFNYSTVRTVITVGQCVVPDTLSSRDFTHQLPEVVVEMSTPIVGRR
jgi:hypothetical protein